jgi:hypothetical protein
VIRVLRELNTITTARHQPITSATLRASALVANKAHS